MKTFLRSFANALLIASLLLVTAASAALAADPCGSTYTVQNKDTLEKIADLCGTTVSNLLALNPQIANPNLIYQGQELLVKGRAPMAIRVTYTTTAESTYTVKEGDTFLSIASEYGVTIWEIIKANPGITFFTKLTEGMELTIPPTTKTTSYTLYRSYLLLYPNARVSVSATQARIGDDIHVSVSGFPPDARIDYFIGLSGKTATFIYDGTIAEDGTAGLTFEIPAGAEKGKTWVVFVTTTSQKDAVKATSPLITIIQ